MSGDKGTPKSPADFFPPDDTNYTKYYDFVVKELERDTVNPTRYFEQLGQLADLIIGGASQISDHHKNYFLEIALPKMSRNLIARRFKDTDDQYQVTCEFFSRIVDLTIYSIPYDRQGTWEALYHVVDDSRRFYSIREDHEFVEFISRVESRKQVEEFVAPLKPKTNSKFCLFFMNYFCTKGGLSLSMERIERESGDRIPIPALRAIVQCWSKMSPFFTKVVRKTFIPRFQESVFKMMLALNDKELRPVKKDDVSEVVRCIGEILEDSSFSAVHERCEMFCLNFALKCFKSSNLEKRMQGLSYIEESIQMTKTRKTYSSTMMMWASGSQYDSKNRFAVAKWMTTTTLMQWIAENEIVESLFDLKNEPHRELIKRSKGLLKFLGEELKITPKTIDTIWQVLETDKTVADAVYEMLGAIATSLEEKIQTYIFKKIQALPYEDYTAGTITLLSELKKIPEEMIQKIWSLIQDESPTSKEIFDTALDHLLERCSGYTNKQFLSKMLRLSLTGLKINQSALQCILILYRITANTKHFCDEKETPKYAAMMKKKDGESTRQDLLNDLINRDQLLDILFKEFIAYMQATEGQFDKLLVANATSPIPASTETLVVLGRFPHLRNVRERLDYLRFVYEFSEAKLDEAGVDVIWNALMGPSRVPEEKRLCLRWFYDLSIGVTPKGESDILKEAALLHIFKKLESLCLSNPAEVTEIGFECFFRYMCSVNV